MKKKYNRGYISGTFDLFHIGHLNIIRRAKEYCDYLIVGVNTDELVMQHKRKTPVIPFEERLSIIESLKYVDYVIPQKTWDKKEELKDIKFDVMFAGDDWKGTDKYNKLEKEFSELGVDIQFFPYTIGTSSTMLTEVLNKINT